MNTLRRDILTALFLGLVVPGLLLNFGTMVLEETGEPPAETTAIQETEPETVSLPVLVRRGETVTLEDMDDYLVGVVLAEMPTTFEPEALKAQAVAARTYARKAWETGGKHGDGSVCQDPTCCQACIAPEDYLTRGGTQEGLEKVCAAVAQTSGYVLTYEGALIEATYFSCSGGSTEAALAVWGTDYPYLRSVESPGEDKALHDRDTVTFSLADFRQRLGLSLEGAPTAWFREVSYTEGGGVEAMTIGEESFTGPQLRTLLDLRSTAFSIEVQEDTIVITTRGYGHRVGMSQYGADAMAVQGKDFREILAHYYQGAELTRLAGEG